MSEDLSKLSKEEQEKNRKRFLYRYVGGGLFEPAFVCFEAWVEKTSTPEPQ